MEASASGDEAARSQDRCETNDNDDATKVTQSSEETHENHVAQDGGNMPTSQDEAAIAQTVSPDPPRIASQSGGQTENPVTGRDIEDGDDSEDIEDDEEYSPEQMAEWRERYGDRWSFDDPDAPMPSDCNTLDELNAWEAFFHEAWDKRRKEAEKPQLKQVAEKKAKKQASKKSTTGRDGISRGNAKTSNTQSRKCNGAAMGDNSGQKGASVKPVTGRDVNSAVTKKPRAKKQQPTPTSVKHTNQKKDGQPKATRSDKITAQSSAYEISQVKNLPLEFTLHEDGMVRLHTAGLTPDEGNRFKVACSDAIDNTERKYPGEAWWRGPVRKLRILLGMAQPEPDEETVEMNDLLYGTRWLTEDGVRKPTAEEEKNYCRALVKNGLARLEDFPDRDEIFGDKDAQNSANEDDEPDDDMESDIEDMAVKMRSATRPKTKTTDDRKHELTTEEPDVKKRDKSHLYPKLAENDPAWKKRWSTARDGYKYILQNPINKTKRHCDYPYYFTNRGDLKLNNVSKEIIEMWLKNTKPAREHPTEEKWPEGVWTMNQMIGMLARGMKTINAIDSAGVLNSRAKPRVAPPKMTVDAHNPFSGRFMPTPDGKAEISEFGRNTLVAIALTNKVDNNYRNDPRQRTDATRVNQEKKVILDLEKYARQEKYIRIQHKQHLAFEEETERDRVYLVDNINCLKKRLETQKLWMDSIATDARLEERAAKRMKLKHKAERDGVYEHLFIPLHPLEEYASATTAATGTTERDDQLEHARFTHFKQTMNTWANNKSKEREAKLKEVMDRDDMDFDTAFTLDRNINLKVPEGWVFKKGEDLTEDNQTAIDFTITDADVEEEWWNDGVNFVSREEHAELIKDAKQHHKFKETWEDDMWKDVEAHKKRFEQWHNVDLDEDDESIKGASETGSERKFLEHAKGYEDYHNIVHDEEDDPPQSVEGQNEIQYNSAASTHMTEPFLAGSEPALPEPSLPEPEASPEPQED